MLAPWPNRVRGARWTLDGETQKLDVTDVARGSAIHGLLRNTPYRLLERSGRALTLGATIFPQHGWPFLVDSWVRYELEADGLTVTHGARNSGEHRAPWAVGAHPYFRVGEHPVDELRLTVDGESFLELDDRLDPIGARRVDASAVDVRRGALIGEVELNVAYGSLGNRGGRADLAWLDAPDGARTSVWADPAFGWLQVYTPRDFPAAEGVATAVALEPMTAPPDALNSGEGLVWLETGQSVESSWGVRYDAVAGA